MSRDDLQLKEQKQMSIVDIATASLLLSDRRENSALAFIGWIALGVLTGFIASKLINKTGHGRHRDVLLGGGRSSYRRLPLKSVPRRRSGEPELL
jgi:hypothetical protein